MPRKISAAIKVQLEFEARCRDIKKNLKWGREYRLKSYRKSGHYYVRALILTLEYLLSSPKPDEQHKCIKINTETDS